MTEMESESDRQWKDILRWQVTMFVSSCWLYYVLDRPYLSDEGFDTVLMILENNWHLLDPSFTSRFTGPEGLKAEAHSLHYSLDEKREALEWVSWRKSGILEWDDFVQRGVPGYGDLVDDYVPDADPHKVDLMLDAMGHQFAMEIREEIDREIVQAITHGAPSPEGIEKFFE